MSYLDYPRMHFTGKFQAAPSTINNTPNNYAQKAYQHGLQIGPQEVYWNPNGNGVFNLVDCVVSKVVYGPGDATTDPAVEPLIGQPIIAAYSKAPPKIVDLDPDQQNVSEIWGLTMQVAGLGPNNHPIKNFVRGDFTETCYHNIWAQAQSGPQSSARGAGAYQSLLTNLAYDATSAPVSKCLEQLASQSPKQLSVLFTVNAHNNAPPNYSFNSDTFTKMNRQGIPKSVTLKITPMQDIVQNVGDTPGDIPTQSYVNYLLKRYLTEAEVSEYEKKILSITAQPYHTDMPTGFTFGYVTGSIGPQDTPRPAHITEGARMLVPLAPKTNPSNYAPFSTTRNGDSITVSVDFSNAIPTASPGFTPLSELTDLKLGYFDQGTSSGINQTNFVVFADVDLADGQLVRDSGGVLDVSICGHPQIISNPLGVASLPAQGDATIWLAEQIQGYYVSADKFVHRMNPQPATGGRPAPAVTAQVDFYATVFGQPAGNLKINLATMQPDEAIEYTVQTMGTGGTRGIRNLSVPQDALKFYDTNGNEVSEVTTNSDGLATLMLHATDPGTPRAEQNLDGQIYFVKYQPDPTVVDNYEQSADSIVSVQVYSATSIPEAPTWSNCIGSILPQYGDLYPVMGNLQLWDYASVYANREMINTVLQKPVQDALHMPVIRDMSDARRETIIRWIEAGAPE